MRLEFLEENKNIKENLQNMVGKMNKRLDYMKKIVENFIRILNKNISEENINDLNLREIKRLFHTTIYNS